MTINRDFFFDYIHEKLYTTGLGAAELHAHTVILDAWDASMSASDDRWLAYMLATAYHETRKTIQPVRETFAKSDEQAARRLENAWNAGKLPWVNEPYWRKDADGKYWFGRGLVQLTHKDNYKTMSKIVSVDLVKDPDKALDMNVAVEIMFKGMTQGSFTTKKYKLADFFHDKVQDWTQARRIINGLESAAKVAGYARDYYAALSHTT